MPGMRKNQTIKTFFKVLTIIVLGSFLLGSDLKPAFAEKSKISFQWAFAALKQSEAGFELEPVDNQVTLYRGDRIKMMLELQKYCFMYVIYHDTDNELTVLFANDSKNKEKPVKKWTQYFLPDKRHWYELTGQAGTETIYLLASKEPMHELETLLDEYSTAPSPQKTATTEKIIEYLTVASRPRRVLTAKAERPQQIGGSIRAYIIDEIPNIDIAQFATKYTSDEFFSKSFTIDFR